MSLIKCPECNKEISDSSDKCIYCGFPINDIKKKNNPKRLVIIFAVALIAIIVIAIVVCLRRQSVIQPKELQVKQSGSDVSSGFEEEKTDIISLARNSKVETETCEFTLEGYAINDVIEPSDCTGSYYHYFEASAGNTYIDVIFSVKSLGANEILQNEILKTVKVIYDDTYEYSCSFVTVTGNGDYESFTNLYTIKPLETMEYHMLTEVPSEVKDSGLGLVCQVETDGKVYQCVLR